MKTIIVKDSFYNSSIVQGLRMLYPKSFVFLNSTEIIADLIFPFCKNIAFVICYPDNLNKEGISRLDAISQVYTTLVVIVCISPEEVLLYDHFLCSIPITITALSCFSYENFQKSASSFIFETIDKFMKKTREYEKSLEQKRKNHDENEFTIYSSFCQNENERNELISLIKQDTSTIRNVFRNVLSEQLKSRLNIE